MADVENVIIIGSGPAGYTAALYTARANLNPLVIEGFLWGGLLQQTTDVENYPGYPEGIMGPEMMQQFRDQAERFGTRFITDNVDEVRARRRRRAAQGLDRGRPLQGAQRDPRDGRRAQEARRARRGGARRPRRVLLRDLRRRLLQGPHDDHRRRRRLRDGGGDLPRQVLQQGHDREPPRRVPRVQDHARARPRDREHRVPDAVRRRGVPGRRRPARWTARGCATSRPARRTSCRCPARSSRSATSRSPRSSTGIVDTDAEGYVATEGKSTRTNIPGVFAAGDLVDHTYRQAVTAAGSGCQAALDAEWYLRDNPSVPTPKALEGTGNLAEEQWAPAARS